MEILACERSRERREGRNWEHQGRRCWEHREERSWEHREERSWEHSGGKSQEHRDWTSLFQPPSIPSLYFSFIGKADGGTGDTQVATGQADHSRISSQNPAPRRYHIWRTCQCVRTWKAQTDHQVRVQLAGRSLERPLVLGAESGRSISAARTRLICGQSPVTESLGRLRDKMSLRIM